MLTKRIRSYPSLLAVFFHDKSFHRSRAFAEAVSSLDDDIPPGREDLALSPTSSRDLLPRQPSDRDTSIRGDPKKDLEFLLFSYLLRFVHRESPIGEFARAGIMFLVDVAFSSGEDPNVPDPLGETKLLLGEFMLDGDFSDVLGAALGAAYSLLPSKLWVRVEGKEMFNTGGGMVLGGATMDEDEDEDAMPTAEVSTNPEFRLTLDTFLKFLEFLQDVIKRGTSSSSSPALDSSSHLTPQVLVGASLSAAILQAVRTTFLDHVLYPSILECSDQDGSVIAVLSYIDIILSTLIRNEPLAQTILEFLVGKDEGERSYDRGRPKPFSTREIKANRRKSSAMILLENMNFPQSSQYPSEGRFTLKDLILDNINSSNPLTATAALKLLRTILDEYPQAALHHLFSTVPDARSTMVPFCLPPLSFSLDAESAASSRPSSPESDMFVYPSPEAEKPDHPDNISAPAPLILPDWILPEPSTTMSAHTLEVEMYLALVKDIDASPTTPGESPNYSNYLRDAVTTLEANPSLTAFQMSLLNVGDDEASSSGGPSTPLRSVQFSPSDKLLQRTLDRLREFFIHTPEENLALTGVLASVAICSELSLEGWLAFPGKGEDDPWRKVDEQRKDGDIRGGQEVLNDEEDDLDFFRSPTKARALGSSGSNPFRESDFSETQPVLLTLFKNLARLFKSLSLTIRSRIVSDPSLLRSPGPQTREVPYARPRV